MADTVVMGKVLKVLFLIGGVIGVGHVWPELPVVGPVAVLVIDFSSQLTEGGTEAISNLASKAHPKTKYYQYTDDTGQVRFAKTLEEIPELWRSRAGVVRMDGPPPTNPGEARAARAAQTAHVKVKFSRTPNLVVYTATWDEPSVQLLAWLDKQGIPYENKDVDITRFAGELRDKTDGIFLPSWELDRGKIHKGFSRFQFKVQYAAAKKDPN